MVSATFGERHVLRFAVGERVVGELLRFLGEQAVGFSFVGALGGVRWVRLGYWDVAEKRYREREFAEQLEVLSLLGDTSRLGDSPHLHLHGVFGRPDYSTVGGHVEECEANPTLELWLRGERSAVTRRHDETTGLDLLDLPEEHAS